VHIPGLNHPESLSIGPDGTPYSVGKKGEVYRVDLATNTAEQYATAPHRCLGQAIDADGNMYGCDIFGGNVVLITPGGQSSVYATGPGGAKFGCANYPAFDRHGNLYMSDSSSDGTWSQVDGAIYKIRPGGGEAELWSVQPVNTPNAIALDAGDRHLYFAETFGPGIGRIAINDDGSAGDYEYVVHMRRHVPDGVAFDDQGRLWIGCHRPDAIYVYDVARNRLDLFVDDWMGEKLRDPTDVAFAGPNRDIMLAASLGLEAVHRLDGAGVRGLALNYPKLS
jgi:sugar lactone lactonase YvrE